MKNGFIIFVCILLQIGAAAQDTINNSSDTSRYSEHSLLDIMRMKSDSIVKSLYGEKFFNSHLKWSNKDSYYFSKYSEDGAFPHPWPDWDTNPLLRKTEFSIRYDILYDGGIMKSGIQILIDNEGNLLPFHRWMDNREKIYNQGFEKIDTTDSDFKLTTEDAIQLACKNGLTTKDTSRVSCTLAWYPTKDTASAIDSGNFYFEVDYNPAFTKGQRRRFQKDDKVEYDSYVWLFAPWTKEFIRKTTIPRYFKSSRVF